MKLTKQVYGTVHNTTGILLGIYGANREEVTETVNRLYNYGVTDTMLGEGKTTAKRGLTDSSDSLGIWSDTFAVVLTDEKRLKNHLTLEAILKIENLGEYKGKTGGAIELVRADVLAAFGAIESEHILSTSGIEHCELPAYAIVGVELEDSGDELDTLTSAARESGRNQAEPVTH